MMDVLQTGNEANSIWITTVTITCCEKLTVCRQICIFSTEEGLVQLEYGWSSTLLKCLCMDQFFLEFRMLIYASFVIFLDTVTYNIWFYASPHWYILKALQFIKKQKTKWVQLYIHIILCKAKKVILLPVLKWEQIKWFL